MNAGLKNVRDLGAADLGRGLAEGAFSSEELTRELLELVAAQDRYGAFLATHEDSSLNQARRADALRAAGQAGPLTGVPADCPAPAW